MTIEECKSENKQLKQHIKELKASNLHSLDTICKLNKIGSSLTSDSEVSSILQNILQNAKDFTNADGGTIYLIDKNTLSFQYILNDTLGIDFNNQNALVEDTDDIWCDIEINENHQNMVVIKAILDKSIVNIDDLYDSSYYNFTGTEAFDKKTGYSSMTTIAVPMCLSNGTIVGILQLFNKTNNDKVIGFSQQDENIVKSLASQASLSIHNSRQMETIMHQSKLAAMGEMIDIIAHQWKQPLNVINLTASEIDIYLSQNIPIDDKLLKDASAGTIEQITHLSETLDEFRSFLRPNKKKQIVNINKALKSILELLKSDIQKNNIEIELIGDKSAEILIIKNEFKHIFINMINNSKDAFNQNKIDKRKISIDIEKKDYTTVIKVIDNAGGIDKKVLDKIFDANFTTKESMQGTGIGLYMSQQIIKKYDGSITAENLDDGICFTIVLKNMV